MSKVFDVLARETCLITPKFSHAYPNRSPELRFICKKTKLNVVLINFFCDRSLMIFKKVQQELHDAKKIEEQ